MDAFIVIAQLYNETLEQLLSMLCTTEYNFFITVVLFCTTEYHCTAAAAAAEIHSLSSVTLKSRAAAVPFTQERWS